MGVRTRVSIIDFIIKKMRRAIAIVEDTDTASRNIASGKYVLWKGVLTKASTAISSGTTLSSSNLTSLDDGAINDLDERISTINGSLAKYETVSLTGKNVGTLTSGSWAKRTYRIITIQIEFNYTASTASNWVPLASIPFNFAPYKVIYTSAWDNFDKKSVFGAINTSGEIMVHSPVNGHNYYISFTYIMDSVQ